MSAGQLAVLAGCVSACLLASGSAPCLAADEALARRLAALRMLTRPHASPALPARSGDPCPGSFWRASQLGVRARTRAAIRDASLRFGLSQDLLRSVIEQESAYDVDAVSHAGAMGIMQLMPSTARELGVRCPFDPRQNILAGARYLRRLYDRFGSWPSAVAAYHAGPARVERGRIPPETRRYTRRVLQAWNPRRFGAVFE